jgi:hypothetical protein
MGPANIIWCLESLPLPFDIVTDLLDGNILTVCSRESLEVYLVPGYILVSGQPIPLFGLPSLSASLSAVTDVLDLPNHYVILASGDIGCCTGLCWAFVSPSSTSRCQNGPFSSVQSTFIRHVGYDIV